MTITITTSNVPPSPEVTLADVRGNDPTLVAEITDARRRLDEIGPEVIALLTEVAQLEERVCDAAEAMGTDEIGIAPAWGQVFEVTGAEELHKAAARIVGAYDAT